MSIIPGTEVDFSIEKEDWNVYELDDGTIIKMRTILTKVVRNPEIKPTPGVPPGSKGAGFDTTFQNVVVVHKTIPQNMGTPTPRPININEAEFMDIGFNEYNPSHFNIYRLETSDLPSPFKIKVKLVLSNVSKYIDLYDQFGYPIYNVNSTNAVVPVPPPTKGKRKRK